MQYKDMDYVKYNLKTAIVWRQEYIVEGQICHRKWHNEQ